MTRGLGGSLLPYRVRDFHSLFLASFPGAQPDPIYLIHSELARQYYQKKISKTKTVVAIKALASKLARASYFVMRDQVDFEATRLFGK